MRRLLAALAILALPTTASAGALDRFEGHRAAPSPSPSTPSTPSAPTTASRDVTTWDTRHHPRAQAEDVSPLLEGLGIIFALPAYGAILAPHHRPRLDPYDRDFVPERTNEETPKVSEGRLRHVEASIGGFVSTGEPIFARSVGVRAHPGPIVVGYSWDRLYETPEPGALARLDLHRALFSSNLLATSARAELLPIIGASWLDGRTTTFGLDFGLEARLFPIRPTTLVVSSLLTIPTEGSPAFLDSKVEAGVVFERFEFRAGIRSLYRGRNQSFWGPTATLAVRL